MPKTTYRAGDILGQLTHYLTQTYAAPDVVPEGGIAINSKDIAHIYALAAPMIGLAPIEKSGIMMARNRAQRLMESNALSEDKMYYPYILEALEYVLDSIERGEIAPMTTTKVESVLGVLQRQTNILPWGEKMAPLANQQPLNSNTQKPANHVTSLDASPVASTARAIPGAPTINISGPRQAPPQNTVNYSSIVKHYAEVRQEMAACWNHIASQLESKHGPQKAMVGSTEIEAGWYRGPGCVTSSIAINTNDFRQVIVPYCYQQKYNPGHNFTQLDYPKDAPSPGYSSARRTLELLGYAAISRESDAYKQLSAVLNNAAERAEGVYPDGALNVIMDGVELRIRRDTKPNTCPEIAFISRTAFNTWLENNPIEGIYMRTIRGKNRINMSQDTNNIGRG